MQYYSQAGLIALLFTSIISLVSAVPIPESISSSTQSPRNIPNLNGQDRIQLDAARNSDILLRGQVSTLPLATRLTRRQFPTDADEELVRRRGLRSSSSGQNKLWNKFKSKIQSFSRAGRTKKGNSKLAKGMDIMNKSNKVMGYMPREFSEEEGFQQRDINEAYQFEERDDIALENREESYSEVYGRDFYERYDLD